MALCCFRGRENLPLFEEKNNGGSRGCYFPLLRNVKEGREEGGKTIDRRTNPQRVEGEEEEVRGDGKTRTHYVRRLLKGLQKNLK